ncbi:hypothetical protein [Burkholderia pseudomallei]|uniref:hypothetical protein n=1 Tax=Burkholderia pseudomallei TaxID=28450 RepID=UPI0011C4CCEE|nr:hypothetical protein [Burkholderia pseudomallei]
MTMVIVGIVLPNCHHLRLGYVAIDHTMADGTMMVAAGIAHLRPPVILQAKPCVTESPTITVVGTVRMDAGIHDLIMVDWTLENIIRETLFNALVANVVE